MVYNCEQGVLLQALKQGLLAAAVTYPRSYEGLVKSVTGQGGLAAAKGWSRSCEDHEAANFQSAKLVTLPP